MVQDQWSPENLTRCACLQVITKAVETDEWVLKLDLLQVCLYYSYLQKYLDIKSSYLHYHNILYH